MSGGSPAPSRRLSSLSLPRPSCQESHATISDHEYMKWRPGSCLQTNEYGRHTFLLCCLHLTILVTTVLVKSLFLESLLPTGEPNPQDASGEVLFKVFKEFSKGGSKDRRHSPLSQPSGVCSTFVHLTDTLTWNFCEDGRT